MSIHTFLEQVEKAYTPGIWFNVSVAKLSREPQYTLSEVLALVPMSERTLRSWIDRRLLPLDADANRTSDHNNGRILKTKQKHRRFSARDVELIRRVFMATRYTVEQAGEAIARDLEQWPFATKR